MQKEITTERLQLTLLSEEEASFILNILNTEGWIRFIGDRNVHTEQDAVQYIRKIRNTPDLIYWVAAIKESKTPAGIISFMKRNYLEYYDIGFAFLPEYQKNGYAFEAAKEVLSIARSDGNYNQVVATTLPDNEKSIRLLNKLGMSFWKEIENNNLKLLVYST